MDDTTSESFERQTAALYQAVGRFAVEFEHVCFAMRHIAMNLLHAQGLKNSKVLNIIFAELTAEPLRSLTAALIAETCQLSSQDEKIVSKVLADVQTLTRDRNDVLHSTWFIGWYGTETGDFGQAPGIKPKRSKKGDASLDRTWRIDEFDVLTKRATSLSDHLRRINACLAGGFKRNFHFNSAGVLIAEGQPYK
ncbi:MAG: hypothetical protein B7Z66_14235 [Chromatiales bacterium 21-64-14]|nr:MAG: hypothetical protein B7Z66_14235 [Chromatiales bacterium 21-64-14]HQU16819.1 hypothetical protein [Gammaproteobacteria bacterium]